MMNGTIYFCPICGCDIATVNQHHKRFREIGRDCPSGCFSIRRRLPNVLIAPAIIDIVALEFKAIDSQIIELGRLNDSTV